MTLFSPIDLDKIMPKNPKSLFRKHFNEGGKGDKNPQNSVNVVYGCPQKRGNEPPKVCSENWRRFGNFDLSLVIFYQKVPWGNDLRFHLSKILTFIFHFNVYLNFHFLLSKSGNYFLKWDFCFAKISTSTKLNRKWKLKV